jgi:hypothetical protein
MSYHISIISENEDLPLSLESVQAEFSGCDITEASPDGQVTCVVMERTAGGEARSFWPLLNPGLSACVLTKLVMG